MWIQSVSLPESSKHINLITYDELFQVLHRERGFFFLSAKVQPKQMSFQSVAEDTEVHLMVI